MPVVRVMVEVVMVTDSLEVVYLLALLLEEWSEVLLSLAL